MLFHNHPYVPWIAGAAALTILGLLIVSSRTAYIPPEYAATWRGAGGIYDFSSIVTKQNARGTSQPPRFSYDYELPKLASQEVTGENVADDPYALLIASIRPSSYPVQETNDLSFLDEVYSLIPQGLRTIPEPKELGEEAHALYEYGNEVGSYIDTYESAYGKQAVSVLNNFYKDRKSASKQEEVRHLADSIERVGKEIAGMQFVPEDLAGMHVLLAERYQDAGRKLANIPEAKNDNELLERITEYDSAADALLSALSTLAIFFATADISFTSHEPGSIFTFSPAGSL